MMQERIDNFDLLDFIHGYCEPVLHATGSEYRINCISRSGCDGTDYKQHLYVNTETKKWYCFKCGYGSSDEQARSNWLPQFLADACRISIPSAIEQFLEISTGVTLADSFKEQLLAKLNETNTKPEIAPRLIPMPSYFYSLNSVSRAAVPYRDYARKRGLLNSEIRKYDVRFCFSKNNYWKNRIIFPLRDREGQIRSFTGRLICSSSFYSKWAIWKDSDIKFLLWPLGIFNQEGEWKKLKIPPSIFITEGILDTLCILHHGQRSLCTFGKKISKEQIELLLSLGVTKINLTWDYDAKSQMQSYLKLLSKYFEVKLFPYQDKFWKNHDLGDVLALADTKMSATLKGELNSPIALNNYDLLSWLMT
jgi:hypothetical protein